MNAGNVDPWSVAADEVRGAQRRLESVRLAPARDVMAQLARAESVHRAASDLRDALARLGAIALEYEVVEDGEEGAEFLPLDDADTDGAVVDDVDVERSDARDVRSETAPAPEPAAPRAPTVEVTEERLAQLQRAMRSQRFSDDEAADEQRRARAVRGLDTVRKALGALHATPHKLTTKGAITKETERVLASHAHWSAWAEAGEAVNFALTSWVTKRARAVQQAAERRAMSAELAQLQALFPRLTVHSKETRPGVIHGLALKHDPQGASWLEDAKSAEAEVRALLDDDEPAQDPARREDDQLRRLTDAVRDGLDAGGFARWAQRLLDGGISPRNTRLARLATEFADALPDELSELRRAAQAELDAETHEDEPRERVVPESWAWRRHTDGRRAMIVGGDPRPERVERLREEFGFDSLEWINNASGAGQRLNSVLERMRNGTVDLVIVMRAFSSHTLTDATFGLKDRACDLVLADTYGVNQVRLAIERFLEAEG